MSLRYAALAAAAVLASRAAASRAPASLTLTYVTSKPLHTVDDRYVNYNIDTG